VIEVLGIIIGIIGFIASIYFYRKDEKNIRILESLMDANYRLYEDLGRAGFRRGRIKKNPDGTYSIAWELKLMEKIRFSSQINAKVQKRNY